MADESLINYPAANLDNDTWEPGVGWQLLWSDEFDGHELNKNNWNRQVEPAGRFNKEWQAYTDSPDNAFVENGTLVIQAIHRGDEHAPGLYTSARLNTAGKQTWTYGKVAARVQLPRGEGLWPAFWMLGTNIDENGGDTPWPASGEIDIFEFYGSRNNAVVEGNVHFENTAGLHDNMGAVPYQLETGIFAEGFHVFEIEWNEQAVAWKVDGVEYARYDITGPDKQAFHKPFFILLNLAVGGKNKGMPDDTTGFPIRMYVDWVRVYQR